MSESAPPAPAADNAIFMQKAAVGEEQESATPIENKELRSSKMVEAAGIEPRTGIFGTKQLCYTSRTKPAQFFAWP